MLTPLLLVVYIKRKADRFGEEEFERFAEEDNEGLRDGTSPPESQQGTVDDVNGIPTSYTEDNIPGRSPHARCTPQVADIPQIFG